MDRNSLNEVNTKMLMYLKSYNFKLCRIGLLERCKNMNVIIGNFGDLENDHMKKISMRSDDPEHFSKCSTELKEKMMRSMCNELVNLKRSVASLRITMSNEKKLVQSKLSESDWKVWMKKIEGLSRKFKIRFSNECNAAYDYHYRLKKYYSGDWDSIFSSIKDITEDLDRFVLKDESGVKFDDFEDVDEGELEKFFSEIDACVVKAGGKGDETEKRKMEVDSERGNLGAMKRKKMDRERDSDEELMLRPADDLTPISDDEEVGSDDEVGSVDVEGFRELLEKAMN